SSARRRWWKLWNAFGLRSATAASTSARCAGVSASACERRSTWSCSQVPPRLPFAGAGARAAGAVSLWCRIAPATPPERKERLVRRRIAPRDAPIAAMSFASGLDQGHLVGERVVGLPAAVVLAHEAVKI